MLERDMRLVALTGGRYHAASLTCIESLEILKRARDDGLTGQRLGLDKSPDAE